MADPLVEENWPELVALEDFLNTLAGTTINAGFNVQGIVEALAAHEKRGGAVPWK